MRRSVNGSDAILEGSEINTLTRGGDEYGRRPDFDHSSLVGFCHISMIWNPPVIPDG
jgi:hypothetical protein